MTFPVCSSPRRFRVRLAVSRCGGVAVLLRVLIAVVVALGLAPSLVSAIEPFIVKDIRVEGVQRTEAGTVFSYLPIKVGERLDDQKAGQAVKALFATGFF